MSGPVAVYDATIAECLDKARNAALRNKPTMWAYYLDMADGLIDWFADVKRDDGAFAGAALVLSERAEEQAPTANHGDAARMWALGIYARRILRAWGVPYHRRPSLAWLHRRAFYLTDEEAAS